MIYHSMTAPHAQSHLGLPVVIHDGIQSMGDCQNRTILEFGSDRFLDELICFEVDGGRRLVQ